jgi:hypothetical protein
MWILGDFQELISGKCIFQTSLETGVRKPHGIPPQTMVMLKIGKKSLDSFTLFSELSENRGIFQWKCGYCHSIVIAPCLNKEKKRLAVFNLLAPEFDI